MLRTTRAAVTILMVLAGAVSGLQAASPSLPPSVRVENIRRAFHNGEHNAFTDLTRWNGKYWLTFRSSPDGHQNYPSASVIVLCSDDTRAWRQVHRFSVPNRDTRDPHFVVFQDKLFLYTGTWRVGSSRAGDYSKDWNSHLGYGTWTRDGVTWAPAKAMEGTFGQYIWRGAAHGGKVYLCARRWRDHLPPDSDRDRTTMETALLESDDGLRWRFRSLIQETDGNETAFLFERDGLLLAVSRTSKDHAVVSRARPPYEKWERHQLAGYLGGPMLARWGDNYIVGGRRRTSGDSITTLMWLHDNKLVDFASLPSGGDNSYPGFVQLDDGRGLVSWYSSHEKGADGKPVTAIYLGELALDRK